ncbi:MAG: DUF2975 domain-containing protein, partial [Tsuneonella sp.]
MLRLNDPLLAIARVVTWFLLIVLAFAGIVVLIAAPAVALNRADVLAEFAAKGVTTGSQIIATIVVLLLAVAALMGLAVWFLRLLLKIIDSVGDGDPFAPVNAVRLNRMAWISLAGYLGSIPLGALVMWLARYARDVGEHVNADFDLGASLLLPLVLFILARVFRHGAAMREDLEGTV